MEIVLLFLIDLWTENQDNRSRVATLDYHPTISISHMGKHGISSRNIWSNGKLSFSMWRASFSELRKTIGENVSKHHRFIEYPSSVLMESRMFAPGMRTPVASIHGIPAQSVGRNRPFATVGHVTDNF